VSEATPQPLARAWTRGERRLGVLSRLPDDVVLLRAERPQEDPLAAQLDSDR
jgi:hypothetical protein